MTIIRVFPEFFSLGAIAAILAACASPPDEIISSYVSSLEYGHLDCKQLGIEANRRNERLTVLHNELETEAKADEAQAAIGIILFWPTLFFLEGGDDARAAEHSHLKGEIEAMNSLLMEKNCRTDVTPPPP